jgi:hypothetical protein
MAFPPLIFEAMPLLAQFALYQFCNVEKSLPNVPSGHFA